MLPRDRSKLETEKKRAAIVLMAASNKDLRRDLMKLYHRKHYYYYYQHIYVDILHPWGKKRQKKKTSCVVNRFTASPSRIELTSTTTSLERSRLDGGKKKDNHHRHNSLQVTRPIERRFKESVCV